MNTKKISIIIIGLLLIIGFLTDLVPYLAFIGLIGGVILVLSQGTFIKNRKISRYASLCFSVFIIGTLFKIMHWQSASLLLLVGLSGICVSYAIHFYQKKTKKLLDILKILWAVTFSISVIMTLLHLPHKYEVSNIQMVLFMIMFGIFSYEQYKK